MTAAFFERRYLMVGRAPLIRVSSVILPSFIGTLKSQRTRTFFRIRRYLRRFSCCTSCYIPILFGEFFLSLIYHICANISRLFCEYAEAFTFRLNNGQGSLRAELGGCLYETAREDYRPPLVGERAEAEHMGCRASVRVADKSFVLGRTVGKRPAHPGRITRSPDLKSYAFCCPLSPRSVRPSERSGACPQFMRFER